MRIQEDRDSVTLAIFTSVLIFAFVAALGVVLMLLVEKVIGNGAALDALGLVVLGCASVAAVSYLWRHRHP